MQYKQNQHEWQGLPGACLRSFNGRRAITSRMVKSIPSSWLLKADTQMMALWSMHAHDMQNARMTWQVFAWCMLESIVQISS